MIKPKKLKRGDKVALVSLSSGLFGDSENKARLDRAINNLKNLLGVEVEIMPNALIGSKEVYEHPELRARDLMDAFKDPSIKAIFSLTGGFDTIRILPYIDFSVIKNNPKIFMGFSDTTADHFMMYHAGLVSFYGPAAGVEFSLPQVPEIDVETVKNTLFNVNKKLDLPYSGKLANDPLDWSTSILDIQDDNKGYEVIQGSGKIRGKLLGGCIDVFLSINGTKIWPTLEEWKDKILFIETSDEQPDPNLVRTILINLGIQGILGVIEGIIVGRPKNGKYYVEYRKENVKALNENFDVILAVSDRVRKIAIDMGINENKVYTNYIGTKFANTAINHKVHKNDRDTINIAYLGYFEKKKGFDFLVESLEKLPKEYGKKINFYCYAKIIVMMIKKDWKH